MITWETARHLVAIGGRVSDAKTDRPIGGARIRIMAGPVAFQTQLAAQIKVYGARWVALPERLDQTWTKTDGQFHFLDLPSGQYTLTASLPGSGTRYGTAQAAVAVSRDANGNLVMTAAEIKLPPTTIEGKVTDPDGTPVVMAEVRVKGSGERVFSDSQGQYRFGAVEAGMRTLLVSAQAFQPAAQAVLLASPGTTQTVNFSLVRTA